MNVGITRSQIGLIIVGSLSLFATNPKWNILIERYKQNQLVVEKYQDHHEIPFTELIPTVEDVPQMSPNLCIEHQYKEIRYQTNSVFQESTFPLRGKFVISWV